MRRLALGVAMLLLLTGLRVPSCKSNSSRSSSARTRPRTSAASRRPPHPLISSGLPWATTCRVVPPSATYGRLMPRGACFCHVFCGAFTVRFTALLLSSQNTPTGAGERARRRASSAGDAIYWSELSEKSA